MEKINPFLTIKFQNWIRNSWIWQQQSKIWYRYVAPNYIFLLWKLHSCSDTNSYVRSILKFRKPKRPFSTSKLNRVILKTTLENVSSKFCIRHPSPVIKSYTLFGTWLLRKSWIFDLLKQVLCVIWVIWLFRVNFCVFDRKFTNVFTRRRFQKGQTFNLQVRNRVTRRLSSLSGFCKSDT